MPNDVQGWRESINEGLSSPDTFGGVPTKFFCVIAAPCVGFAFLVRSWWMLAVVVAIYVAAAALTRWDPFWPSVFWDFLKTPNRIDP